MASVPVVIVGTMKDNDSDEERQVTITGLASIQGLQIGGGPMPGGPELGGPGWGWIPGTPGQPNWPNLPGFWPGTPPPRPHPQPPLVIWGPGDPRPTLPIAGWDPGSGTFPGGGGGDHKPKFEAKVGWTAETGWVVVFVPLEGTLVPTPSAEGT